jgi:hypothetical protein
MSLHSLRVLAQVVKFTQKRHSNIGSFVSSGGLMMDTIKVACPRFYVRKNLIALFYFQRLHQFQQILGFKAQQLGGGGAISLSPGKGFQD